MSTRGFLIGATLAVVAPIPAASQRTVLVAGMELVYESNGARGNPWVVERVEHNVARGNRTGCLRVRFAPGGPRRDADDRVTCESGDTLFAWDSTANAWRASRPIAPNATLDVRGATTTSRYSTGAARDETIGAHTLRVVETTLVTADTTGRAIRRLRERYAPALGTATWGVFEVPDTANGGWRVQQEFTLVAIRGPAR